MPDYNFHNLLSPSDFETLTRDILQKHLKIFLESFKTGKDNGIDLRYSIGGDDELVVQCKCYASYKSLNPVLKKESAKVSKLQPRRYILSTSAGLLPQQKKKIQKTFTPFIRNTADILGRDDLNNLLMLFPKIEEAHYKLWLSSTNILKRITNNAVLNRSEFDRQAIEQDIRLFVKNDSLGDAKTILDERNYVIISGIPGIGKTTLARLLIFGYLMDGYELVSTSFDISEAEQAFETKNRQVFYYDDFLGRNFLEDTLQKNEDQRLIKFISKIVRDPSKKLIMTTREYILKQATEKYEVFSQSDLDVAKCIVDLQKYTRQVRADILFNHLYFSKLSIEYIEALFGEDVFLKIIDHPNFSPRIIQMMTNSEKIHREIQSPNKYAKEFLTNLENPVNIWLHAYLRQITELSQNLLLVLLSLGNYSKLDDLRNALWNYCELSDNDTFSFLNSLKELDGTFIDIFYIKNQGKYIKFKNPSIKDFLIHIVSENSELISHIILKAVYFNQLTYIFTTDKTIKDSKVFLDDQLAILASERVINTFEQLKGVSLIDRLDKLIILYDLDNHPSVCDFICNEIDKMHLETRTITRNPKTIVDLLEALNDHIAGEYRYNILVKILESQSYIDDIDLLNRIKELFPRDFERYIEFKQTDYHSIVYDFVSNEVDYICSNPDDFDYFDIERIRDEIDQLEYEIGIDLSYHELPSLDYPDDSQEGKNLNWTKKSDSVEKTVPTESIRSQFESLIEVIEANL